MNVRGVKGKFAMKFAMFFAQTFGVVFTDEERFSLG